jgi:hypothetical protein
MPLNQRRESLLRIPVGIFTRQVAVICFGHLQIIGRRKGKLDIYFSRRPHADAFANSQTDIIQGAGGV